MRLGSRGGIAGGGPGNGLEAVREGSGLVEPSENALIWGSESRDGPLRIGQASGIVSRPPAEDAWDRTFSGIRGTSGSLALRMVERGERRRLEDVLRELTVEAARVGPGRDVPDADMLGANVDAAILRATSGCGICGLRSVGGCVLYLTETC